MEQENINTPAQSKYVVLSFSGGLDSTSLLMTHLAQGQGVIAVSFKYGQKHSEELKRAAKIVKQLQKWGLPVDHKIVDLSSAFAMSASNLVGQDKDIPKAEYDIDNQKVTVVENRNVIFSSIIYGMALSLSKTQDADVSISQGVHAGDHSLYPDCTAESIGAAQHLYTISNWGSERVHFVTPFVHKDKAQVLGAGLAAMKTLHFNKPKIKKIYGLTLSCYDPDESGKPCGQCATCMERKEAFNANKMEDPSLV